MTAAAPRQPPCRQAAATLTLIISLLAVPVLPVCVADTPDTTEERPRVRRRWMRRSSPAGASTRRVPPSSHSSALRPITSRIGVVAAIILSSHYDVTEDDRSRPNVMAFFGEDASQYRARSPKPILTRAPYCCFSALRTATRRFCRCRHSRSRRRSAGAPRNARACSDSHGDEVSGFTDQDQELGLQILDFMSSVR
jgi:hypothetical protein